MVIDVEKRDIDYWNYEIFLDGINVSENCRYANEEEGFVLLMIRDIVTNYRMIGADINRPDIESPIIYKLNGKVKIVLCPSLIPLDLAELDEVS